MKLSRYAKAVVALVGPPVTVALGSVEEAVRIGAHVHWSLIAATAVLGAWTALIVWAVPNAPPANFPQV